MTRINFSARHVIVPMIREHKINEIELPYLSMLELFKNELVYLLKNMDKLSYAEALSRWEKGAEKFDKRLYLLMKYLIEKKQGGLYVLINRNPTINYGSILLMRVTGVKGDGDYTMSVPLNVLTKIAGDFDGDVLNIISLKLQEFVDYFKIFDPRYMMIDRNNGKFDSTMSLIKDQIIGLYSFNK